MSQFAGERNEAIITVPGNTMIIRAKKTFHEISQTNFVFDKMKKPCLLSIHLIDAGQAICPRYNCLELATLVYGLQTLRFIRKRGVMQHDP